MHPHTLTQGQYAQPPHHMLEPFGGYDRYLAQADTGAWRRLTRPGAEGYGLMVCMYSTDSCCSGYRGDFHRNDDGTPWLVPAAVTWTSVVDPATDRVYRGLSDHDTLVFPPVALTSWQMLDNSEDGWSELGGANLCYPDYVDREGSYESDAGLISGLTPVVAVLPITEEAHGEIHEALIAATGQYATDVLWYTDCTIDEEQSHWWQERFYDLDGEEQEEIAKQGHLPVEHNKPECRFLPGEKDCRCGMQPTPWQYRDAILSEPDFALWVLPEDYHPLWTHALERYAHGWEAIAQHADQGDPWSTSSLQLFSPFWGSSSPGLLLQRLAEGSPSSPRRLAS